MPLPLQSLELHLVRERLFARQDPLALHVGIDHRHYCLVAGHLPDHRRHLGKPGALCGALSPVPAHQLVTTVLLRANRQRGEDSDRGDAGDEVGHVVIVSDVEGMVRKGVDQGKGNVRHLLPQGIVPFFLVGEQLIYRRQIEGYLSRAGHRQSPPLRAPRTLRRLFPSGRRKTRSRRMRVPPRRGSPWGRSTRRP